MTQNVVSIIRPQEPTLRSPYGQVIWIFHQVEREYEGKTAAQVRYSKNKYLQYLEESHAANLGPHEDPRFYLATHWTTDALIQFCTWLEGRVASKTRYSLYKTVRKVMDFAYALRLTDTLVYHPPVFIGVRETDSRSAYAEEHQDLINSALARWTNLAVSVLKGYEVTGRGVPYKKRKAERLLMVDGLNYETAEAVRVFGVSHGEINNRLKLGWSDREAVGIERRTSSSGEKKAVEIEGVIYSSRTTAAKAYNVDPRTVNHLLQNGYTPEQAVGLTPHTVLQSDERALLWAFENDYSCDANAMLTKFHEKRWSVVCSAKRMRNLFSRWGVWPFIDDRLIMPLATQLGVLTGLNVESLKMLDIDSYQDEHGLTKEPVISYSKRRSGSTTRSEDHPLHLGILELEEQFIPGAVAQKVKALIELILALTARIRDFAPSDLTRRLVIFEDVEATRRCGTRQVVGLDPRGKAASWYGRFKREEGLAEAFGADFSFNISRCRPTLVTNMVLGGASMLQLQAVLAHCSIQTSATYLDEHHLQPAFNREVSDAMEKIVLRSKDVRARSKSPIRANIDPQARLGFNETLSGCGCFDPYSPSESVRSATKHKDGSVCKFWNMCLFCDQSIVTEVSLPKIIVYHRRVNVALEEGSPAIRPKEQLFRDVVVLIEGILKDDVIFPRGVIEEARHKAVALDEVLVDQLIYQGI